MNESNLTRSAAEHARDHAGAQYVNLAMKDILQGRVGDTMAVENSQSVQ